MSSTLRYSWRAMLPGYAGSIVGLACSLAPLALMQPAAPVAWVLTAAGALFLVYFVRTVCRQLTQIELDDDGIRVRGPEFLRLGAAIRWQDLRSLRLGYYSTRRDREGGWMQLRLRDARRTIRVDSELDGFVDLVRNVLLEARRRGIELDEPTRANLDALGLAE